MIAVRPASLGALAAELGGALAPGLEASVVEAVATAEEAGEGRLAPLTSLKYLEAARQAAARGAALLVAEELARDPRVLALCERAWRHPHAAWALAGVLDRASEAPAPPAIGAGSDVHPTAVVFPGAIVGARARVGPYAVVGGPGFGWAFGPSGQARHVPQLGGVVLGDDVWVGPHTTIDAGTLAPTRIEDGVKLDAHVHVGHNCAIGAGTIVAAQAGFAGSVKVGRGVLVGGQAGVADHITIGDGARLAAKAGVIGDVPPGAVVAGYPAVARTRWLRGLAALYRSLKP